MDTVGGVKIHPPLQLGDFEIGFYSFLVPVQRISVFPALDVDMGRHVYQMPRIRDQFAQVIARQQLTPVYHRNGASYAISRACLLDQRSIMGRRASAVVTDEPLVSIDTLEDFEAVERALAARDGDDA